MAENLLVFGVEAVGKQLNVAQTGQSPTVGLIKSVDVISAGSLLAVSRYRRIPVAQALLVLDASYFPTVADPRPTLLLCSGVANVEVPAGLYLTLPSMVADDGPFVNFWQLGGVQIVYSATGGAVLAPVAGENKSAGENAQQVLTFVEDVPETWLLGGRTVA